MRIIANLLLFFGAIGVGMLLSFNLYDVVASDEPSAMFFSDDWWIEYWGLYVVMVSVLLLGIMFALTSKRG